MAVLRFFVCVPRSGVLRMQKLSVTAVLCVVAWWCLISCGMLILCDRAIVSVLPGKRGFCW